MCEWGVDSTRAGGPAEAMTTTEHTEHTEKRGSRAPGADSVIPTGESSLGTVRAGGGEFVANGIVTQSGGERLAQGLAEDQAGRKARWERLQQCLACSRRLERYGRHGYEAVGLTSPLFWIAVLATIHSGFLTDAPLPVWALGQGMVLALASSIALVGIGSLFQLLVALQVRRFEWDGLLPRDRAAGSRSATEWGPRDRCPGALPDGIKSGCGYTCPGDSFCLWAAILSLGVWGGELGYVLAPHVFAVLAWVPPIAVLSLHSVLPLAAFRRVFARDGPDVPQGYVRRISRDGSPG